MKTAYANLPKTTLKYYLVADQISEAVEKKLLKLGWPNIWLTYSLDPKLALKDLGDGTALYVEGEFGETFPLTEPTKNGSFSIPYSPSDKSVDLTFEGEFLIHSGVNPKDAKDFKKLKEGFSLIISLNDTKGKPIILKKDEYGISLKLEAVSTKAGYDGPYYRIPVSLTVKDED